MLVRMRYLTSLMCLGMVAALASGVVYGQVEPEWRLEGGHSWKPRTLALGRLFQIGINGQSTPFRLAMDELEKGTGAGATSSGPGNLVFEVKPFKVERTIHHDERRKALVVLDIFINTQGQESRLQVDYATPVGGQGGVRFTGTLSQHGERRDVGQGVPDGTWAAVILAEKGNEKAVPFFIWGQPDAPWRAVVQDVGATLRLRYEGGVPAHGKVALLHYVGAAEGEGLEDRGKVFERFVRDGKLIEPGIGDDRAALVVNFRADTLGVTAGGGAASRSGRLVALEALASRLGVQRGSKATLWMSKEENISGDLAVGKVWVRRDGQERELPVESIAALRGGAGKGREHRLYLRDGSVLPGEVRLELAKMKTDLGELALAADSLDALFWPVVPGEGQVPPEAAEHVQLLDGSRHWIKGSGADPRPFIASFGTFGVTMEELWLVARRVEPPHCMVVTLTDGSRIQGVFVEESFQAVLVGEEAPRTIPFAKVEKWGAVEAALREMAAAPDPKEPPKGAGGEGLGRYCWMRDGSLLVGTLRDGEVVRCQTSTGLLELPVENLARLYWDAASAPEASLELVNGSRVRGEILNEFFDWQLAKQVVRLPAGLIAEIVRKPKP